MSLNQQDLYVKVLISEKPVQYDKLSREEQSLVWTMRDRVKIMQRNGEMILVPNHQIRTS